MANQVIGHSVCPCCALERLMDGKPLAGLPLQEVRLSEKSNKPYINCDECGSQAFSRQPASVNIMRRAAGHDWGMPKPVAPTAATPPAQPVQPAPPKPAAPVAKPAPTPPVEKPAPKEGEKTLFDVLFS